MVMGWAPVSGSGVGDVGAGVVAGLVVGAALGGVATAVSWAGVAVTVAVAVLEVTFPGSGGVAVATALS
jgi:hypothetical protein